MFAPEPLKIFLGSSVALAACLFATDASRQVFDLASRQHWQLAVSPWVLREVRDNVVNKTPNAFRAWVALPV